MIKNNMNCPAEKHQLNRDIIEQISYLKRDPNSQTYDSIFRKLIEGQLLILKKLEELEKK